MHEVTSPVAMGTVSSACLCYHKPGFNCYQVGMVTAELGFM